LILRDAVEDISPDLVKDIKRISRKIQLLKAQNKIPKMLPNGSIIKKIYRRYQELLRFHKALDYEDLIIEACSLINSNKNILQIYQKKCENLLVDEFQDMNPAEYTLIKLLAGNGNGLLVVGDDDQSIYTFRGSTPQIILGFTDDYINSEEKIMTACFRCPPKVLLGALGLIINNRHRRNKQLKPL
ncbi:unnamed protein product, partial [marine sediment metagenome]